MAELSLSSKVKAFWTKQHTAGHAGLQLLDACIQHTAEHRDWDALSRFMSASGVDKPKIALIVKAAFGDAIEYKVDKKHETGGRFTLKWDGAFNLAARNHYGIIAKGIADKKSFRSADFLKDLREAVGKPDPAKKEYLAQLEDMLKYVSKKVKDFPEVQAVMADTVRNLERAIAAQKAKGA
jgi:hypothetical protein